MIEQITALDTRILEALYAVRDLNLSYGSVWISEFGRAWTVYGLATCTALALLLHRHYAYAAGLAISVASGGVGVLLLKGLVQRARPPQEFQAYLEIWYSFPSAHAALSATFYGFLMFLAWRMISHLLSRYLAIASLILIVTVVSFSRIYLGVHWASDVVTGLALGAACALLGVWWVRFTERS